MRVLQARRSQERFLGIGVYPLSEKGKNGSKVRSRGSGAIWVF